MWPDLIIRLPPALDDHLGLPERVEELSIQQLVPQFAIEALDIPVLPGAAWFDVQGPNAHPDEPVSDRFRRKLRAIIGADVFGHPALDEQLRQPMQNIVGSQMTRDLDGQTFPRVLVHDR